MEDKNKQNIDESKATIDLKSNEQTKIKKKRRKLIIWVSVIALLVILPIVLIAGFYTYYSKPENVYKKIISKGIEAVICLQNNSYETVGTNMNVDFNLTTYNPHKTNSIWDLINNLDLSVSTQVDTKEKQMVTRIESDYKSDSIVDIKTFVDAENKTTYIYAKDIIDKYLKIDLDEELYGYFEDMFNGDSDKESKKTAKILTKEFASIIKPEYCSVEEVKTIINGKSSKVKKVTLKMTVKELMQEIKVVLENLKTNQEFLNCFKQDKQQIINKIDSIIEQCKENIESVDNEKLIVQTDIYITGIIPSFKKIEYRLYEENNTMFAIIEKVATNEVYFETGANDTITSNGKIRMENVNECFAEIKLILENIGTLMINIKYKQEYNVVIDKIDLNNSQDIANLSYEDKIKAIMNFQTSKLYSVLEEYEVFPYIMQTILLSEI